MNTKIKIALLNNTCLKDKVKYVVARLIKNNDFIEKEINPEELPSIISNGNIIAHLHKNNVFRKTSDYSNQYYKGSQLVVVDVDGVPEDPKTFISHLKYQPTAYCTSYSNKIKDAQHPNGDNEWRFHLYYAFDQIIYGIDNYYTVFDEIVKDFPKIVKDDEKVEDSYDKNLRSPKMTPFTSYKDKLQNKDFYMLGYTGIIYNVSDFNLEENKEPMYDYNYKAANYSRNVTVRNKEDFTLDPEFLKDLKSLNRKVFIDKYQYIYPYITQTIIPPEKFKDDEGNDKPYADLRDLDFYSVPSEQRLWDPVRKKPINVMIRNGKRHTMIYRDSNGFKMVLPNPTKEHFVYCVTRDLFYHYAESYEFTAKDIINIARDAWYNNSFDPSSLKKNKKFKSNPCYYESIGIYDKKEQTRLSRIQMTDDDIAMYYDDSFITIEQNLENLHRNGLKTKKERLIQWCIKNNKPYKTEKQVIEELVLYLKNEDNTRGYKTISHLCEEQGYDITPNTVKNILKRNKILS